MNHKGEDQFICCIRSALALGRQPAIQGGKSMHLVQKFLCVGAAFAAFAFVSAASAQTPSTLEVVKKRGQLICGVNVGLGGFSLPDSQGKWSGLDVDLCNAAP